MTVLEQVYSRFARDHYVGRLFRRPEHVEALLKAAAMPPTKVDETFWRQIRPDWFWGVSPFPSKARARAAPTPRIAATAHGVASRPDRKLHRIHAVASRGKLVDFRVGVAQALDQLGA